MSLSPSTIAGGVVGTTATATPLWWDWLPPTYQIVAAILGLVLLVVTIRKQLKESAKLDRDEKRDRER